MKAVCEMALFRSSILLNSRGSLSGLWIYVQACARHEPKARQDYWAGLWEFISSCSSAGRIAPILDTLHDAQTAACVAGCLPIRSVLLLFGSVKFNAVTLPKIIFAAPVCALEFGWSQPLASGSPSSGSLGPFKPQRQSEKCVLFQSSEEHGVLMNAPFRSLRRRYASTSSRFSASD